MLRTDEDMPLWMMEENLEKWRIENEYGEIAFKDNVPNDIIRSYIDSEMEDAEMMGLINVRPPIETMDFAEMRKNIGYTEQQINEDIIKVYPRKFANEYLTKSKSLFDALENRDRIRKLPPLNF